MNFSLDTLIRLAAVFKLGLVVKFVPYSEMLEWENGYSQDGFSVTPLEEDAAFLAPAGGGRHLARGSLPGPGRMPGVRQAAECAPMGWRFDD